MRFALSNVSFVVQQDIVGLRSDVRPPVLDAETVRCRVVDAANELARAFLIVRGTDVDRVRRNAIVVVVFERIGHFLFVALRSGELAPISYRALYPADKSIVRRIGHDRFIAAHRYRARG